MQVKFGQRSNFKIPIVQLIFDYELETLRDPQSLGRWQLDLTAKPYNIYLRDLDGVNHDFLKDFLNRRMELFAAIRNDMDGEKGSVETCQILNHADLVVGYANAYLVALSALQQQLKEARVGEADNVIAANREILGIDVLKIKFPFKESKTATHVMLPTHPLKLLWYLQYAKLLDEWSKQLLKRKGEEIVTLSEALNKILCLNYPNAIPDQNDLLVNVDNLTFFLSVFVRTDLEDLRTLMSALKSALAMEHEDEWLTLIGAADIANKIIRYVRQHPYVSTLRVNAIKPGSGSVLLDALLQVHMKFPSLRYSIKMFGDERRERLGFEFDEIIAGESVRTSEALDTLVSTSKNPLFPRIVFSKHQTNELMSLPQSETEAHLTFMFDHFSTTSSTRQGLTDRLCSYMRGLVQEYTSDFSTLSGRATWSRQINPNETIDLGENDSLSSVIYQLFRSYNDLLSSFATKESSVGKVPTIQLELSPNQVKLLDHIHDVSDWVCIVDRNFGIEYLDNPYDPYCKVFLIDYVPEFVEGYGHRLIVSTKHLEEVNQIIKKGLEPFQKSGAQNQEKLLIDVLNAISGRLLMKLQSSPSKAIEATSMAFARLFMEQTGFLLDKILVPLDSHTNLFFAARNEQEALQQEMSLRRTDFLLLDPDFQHSNLNMCLVEVKVRDRATVSLMNQLKEDVAEQMGNTENVLRRLFEVQSPDRFDRDLQSKQLVSLIEFYANRGLRHRLLTKATCNRILSSLSLISNPYSVTFEKHCLVFVQQEDGYNHIKEGDVEYHIIGRDMIPKLIEFFTRTRDLQPDQRINATIEYQYRASTTNRKIAGLPNLRPIPLTTQAKSDLVKKEPALIPSIPSLKYDILIGSSTPKQYGILGKISTKTVALDLNECNTLSIFGVQNSGKSYTLGSIIEMSLMAIPNINELKHKLSVIVFHYSQTETYPPEYVTLTQPNDVPQEIQRLAEYDATPSAVKDIVILVPNSKLEKRRQQYPVFEVQPILFNPSEISYSDWEHLMGIPGSEAMYVREMKRTLRALHKNNKLTLANLESAIKTSAMTDGQKQLAKTRLEFAREYLSDTANTSQHVAPGKLTIIDLRSEMIDKTEAMRLLMILLNLFSVQKEDDKPLNKLVVLDEAHKYLDEEFADLIAENIREMRHKATSVLIASQDPLSVPREVIELSSIIILHRMTSPDWLRHLQHASTPLSSLKPSNLNSLSTKGEAYVWAKDSTESSLQNMPQKILFRPRVTKHGGATLTAVR